MTGFNLTTPPLRKIRSIKANSFHVPVDLDRDDSNFLKADRQIFQLCSRGDKYVFITPMNWGVKNKCKCYNR